MALKKPLILPDSPQAGLREMRANEVPSGAAGKEEFDELVKQFRLLVLFLTEQGIELPEELLGDAKGIPC